MGKSSQAGMVIDAEVVSREERPVAASTASASRWVEPPAGAPPSPAAPPSGPASGKPKRKRRSRKARAAEAAPQGLQRGALKVKLPPPPPVRGLICPVCLSPAEPDRRVELGPVHAYLCDRCGGIASGALQVVDFLKRFK